MRRYLVAIDDEAFTIDVAETASDAFEVTVGGRTYEARLQGDHDLPGVAISPMIAGHDPHPEPPAGPAATPASRAAVRPTPRPAAGSRPGAAGGRTTGRRLCGRAGCSSLR